MDKILLNLELFYFFRLNPHFFSIVVWIPSNQRGPFEKKIFMNNTSREQYWKMQLESVNLLWKY